MGSAVDDGVPQVMGSAVDDGVMVLGSAVDDGVPQVMGSAVDDGVMVMGSAVDDGVMGSAVDDGVPQVMGSAVDDGVMVMGSAVDDRVPQVMGSAVDDGVMGSAVDDGVMVLGSAVDDGVMVMGSAVDDRVPQVMGSAVDDGVPQVPFQWSSFNTGDVFLVDLGKLIIQWNGPESNRMERLRGMNLAKDIRDRERGGRAHVYVVEGDNEEASPKLMEILLHMLGERREIRGQIADDVVDNKAAGAIKLYRVSDNNGNLMVEEVATKPLTQDLLDHNDCFILDQGGIKIFIWKGKNSSKEERQQAMERALNFIKAKNYPPSTNIEIQNDGSESATFKQLFQKWTTKDQTIGMGKTTTVGKVAKVEQVKFDAVSMHAKPEIAAQQKMVDDGSGEVEVYRIENLELAPVEKQWLGHFYGGDCYLILYKYLVNNKYHYILYIWQGRHASQDEIAASAYQAVILDQQYEGQPVQVRVPMGKEPSHLMAVFKGKMVVYEGGTSRTDSDYAPPETRLFHVHGTNEYNTKAFEVPVRATSLNSNDVFVLKTKGVCYLWCGKGCSGDERAMAKNVADIISRGEKVVVAEGQEPSEFWLALGGKSQYSSSKRLQEEVLDISPRLYECSNQTGTFRATEVTDFSQDDLEEEDVFLLDAWDQVEEAAAWNDPLLQERRLVPADRPTPDRRIRTRPLPISKSVELLP
ncbi:villin-1-like [Hyla sarda]|uniref:villin-1-like n=1 Tax=Hyla sarda TaxID=327740 RepID=UPI0024C35171|nr:villin-1-like [Hyla sarda]